MFSYKPNKKLAYTVVFSKPVYGGPEEIRLNTQFTVYH